MSHKTAPGSKLSIQRMVSGSFDSTDSARRSNSGVGAKKRMLPPGTHVV